MKLGIFMVLAASGVVLGGALLARGDSPPAVDYDRDYEYVTKVNVGDDSYGYIMVKDNFDMSVHNCANAAFARTKNDISDVVADIQLRIAVTSFVTKKPVHVWTSGCSTPAGYPIMTKIQVQQDVPYVYHSVVDTNQLNWPKCTTGNRCCGTIDTQGRCHGTCIPNNRQCF